MSNNTTINTMKALINYFPILNELSSILLTSHNGVVEKQQLRTTIQQYIIHKHLKTKITGADRMEKIVSLATSLPGYELSYFQRLCMDAILSIISPIVFKGESAQDIADYFRKTGRKLSKSRMLLLTTSRRSGKTDLLTIVAAVLLITVPNIEMLCWSLYNETSSLFGSQMEKWIIDLGYKSQIQKAEGHIIFKSGYDDDRRTIVFMGSQNPNVIFVVCICILFM